MFYLFGFPRLFWMLEIDLSVITDYFESGPDNRIVISGWPLSDIKVCMLYQLVEYHSGFAEYLFVVFIGDTRWRWYDI